MLWVRIRTERELGRLEGEDGERILKMGVGLG
jgi:hypothetical protein